LTGSLKAAHWSLTGVAVATRDKMWLLPLWIRAPPFHPPHPFQFIVYNNPFILSSRFMPTERCSSSIRLALMKTGPRRSFAWQIGLTRRWAICRR